MKYQNHLCISVLVGACLVAGCTSAPVQPTFPIGDIAVVAAQHPPEADFNVYALGKSKAAGELGKRGAVGGAAIGAILPLELSPVGIVAYPILAPFTILAGAVIGGAVGAGSGAIRGLPETEVEKVSFLVDQAVHQLGIHEQVAKRVADLANQSGHRVDLVANIGPVNPSEEADYKDLKGIYAGVLELTVSHVGMAARKGDIPRIALEMKMRAKVVNWETPENSGVKTIEWSGRPRPLSEWEVGGGQLLASDFDQGYETLADYAWEILSPISVDSEK